MNVFVVSKGDVAERDHPTWRELRRLGHVVTVDDPTRPTRILAPDVVISMGITVMDQTWQAMEKWPDARLYCYNWDVYEWVWTRPRKEETPGTPAFLDYRRYGDLLRRAQEVWVPSECTGRRTTQWYGLTNWRVILSACPWWEHDNVRDDGYALCCLREIPDPWWGVFERCCEELKIPYKAPRHELSWEEYKDVVAGCRFICAPLYELSTGGLSLMEAYYHGKPVLISSSEWNGAKDYFGIRAKYFEYGNENNFKFMLGWMNDAYKFMAEPKVKSDHREYITTNFSDERFARDIHASLAKAV